MFVGMDPCLEGIQNCDPNSNCIPRGDQYDCVCKTGFSGDGRVCTGMLYGHCFYSYLQAFKSQGFFFLNFTLH